MKPILNESYQQKGSSSNSSLYSQQSDQSWIEQKQVKHSYLTTKKIRKISNQENKQKKVRSAYHNSQKHAITTLKNMVSVEGLDRSRPIEKLAYQLWSTFLECKGKNKQILTILYGSSIQNQQKMMKRFVNYRFEQFLAYSFDEINKAQQILRQITISQINEVTLTHHMKLRKMGGKECFQQYMLHLINQLKNGPIQRRITMQKTQQLIKSQQTELKSIDYADEIDQYLNSF